MTRNNFEDWLRKGVTVRDPLIARVVVRRLEKENVSVTVIGAALAIEEAHRAAVRAQKSACAV